ncbi:MAG: hypothetical protein AB7F59_08165 [Bdellovibrionales bacterium]
MPKRSGMAARMSRLKINSSGFMIIEGVIAVMLTLIIASGVGYYVNSNSTSSIAVGNASYCNQYVTSFSSFLQSSQNNLTTISSGVALTCSGTVQAVPQSAVDPYCPTTNAGLNVTGPAGDQVVRRRALLCGQFSGEPADSQVFRNGATWAQNLYINCGNAAGCGFGTSGLLHNLISATPLVLDTDVQIQTFYDLLPQPWLFPAGGSLDELNPSPVRLEVSIRPLNVFNRNVTFNWGAGPTSFATAYKVNDPNGYQITLRPYFKKVARLPVSAENPMTGCQDVTMIVGFTQDNSSTTPIVGAPWLTELVNSGADGVIDQVDPNGATNADNSVLNAPNNIYYRDGSVRQAGAKCSCPTVAAGSFVGESCVGWDDVGVFARLNEPHAVPVAEAGVNTTPEQCAEAVYPGDSDMRDYTLATNETYLSSVWRNMPHSRLLSVGIRDSAGNLLVSAAAPATPQSVMIIPGFCPATNTYCSDGSQTDLGNMATSAAACGANTNTYPGAAMNINCKPHDGCFGLCGSGSRAYNNPAGHQANCPATNTYCSVGVNRGPYACTAGIDCTLDARCADSVCDECGHDTCPNSTIPVGNTCPATASYCPAAVVGGGGIWGRPTDTCGAACPVGTRAGVGCPNPAAVCIGTGTGVDDCGNACPAATYGGGGCADPATVACGVAINNDCGFACGTTGTSGCGGGGAGGGGGCPEYGWDMAAEAAHGAGGHYHCLGDGGCGDGTWGAGDCEAVHCVDFCCSSAGMSCCDAGMGGC